MHARNRIEPGPGQESVWDYPRPPRLEHDLRRVEVEMGDIKIADTTGAIRVLETSHPPGYYLPPQDVRTELLAVEATTTVCEWKGVASYWGIRIPGKHLTNVAWSYESPTEGFEEIAGYISFYPGRVSSATVGGETVRAQAGGFYGGWILDEIVGPFKGEPGTIGW